MSGGGEVVPQALFRTSLPIGGGVLSTGCVAAANVNMTGRRAQGVFWGGAGFFLRGSGGDWC